MRQPLPRIFITAAVTGNLTTPEQTPHLSRGELAPSNAAMVTKIRRITEALGADIATSAQARDMLGLPQGAA